jgi:DNA-binding XRE family transcriptional regulator
MSLIEARSDTLRLTERRLGLNVSSLCGKSDSLGPNVCSLHSMEHSLSPKNDLFEFKLYSLEPRWYSVASRRHSLGPTRYRLHANQSLLRLTMSPVNSDQALALLAAVRKELILSQSTLGKLVGRERRTVMRWQQGRANPYPWHWEAMARAVHPRNRALASQLAAAGGHTLVSLGLEAPAPPPAPPPPAPAPAGPAPRHLVDSIVCAAAEAIQLTPQAIRPALVAAFERASALGMASDAVLGGLAPAKPRKGQTSA